MSNLNQRNNDFYVVGGTMRPDAPSYIERNADNELYQRTLAGDFCYVLTPRQMGKSSLMARTAQRLKKAGIHTAVVDLTQIGAEQEEKSADQWYYGIAHRIVRKLGFKIKLSHWWEEREKLPALNRLTEFFEDIVLKNTKEKVVIFVDEIDTTIALPFTDDFFAAIRACHNARATQPGYNRLSFVLLGGTTPSQLIKDTRRTPFNIGHRIELTDFTFQEARLLAHFPGTGRGQGEDILKRILYWTGGHPYLTQKLCRIVVDEEIENYSDESIDVLVERHFLSPDVHRRDSNLNFVRDRLVPDKKLGRKLLMLYRRILKGRPITDEPLSSIHSALKLSGVVVPRKNRQLSVRNRIYERIFTTKWVTDVMPTDWNRNIAVASIGILFLGFAVWYTQFLPRGHIDAIIRAEDDVPIFSYEKLRKLPGFAGKADTLFADYWDRRALRSEVMENRAKGVLYRLKALNVKETGPRQREVSRLVGNDYKNLLFTYRHNASVLAVAFSPDGKTVLTGSVDGTARLWRADTGKPLGKPMTHGNWVRAVAFSPDEKTLLTGSDDGTA
ncbi:MAG: hypothetical protein GY950_28900, partial [bacterium]|nr:hypothetical protein [bacterium]